MLGRVDRISGVEVLLTESFDQLARVLACEVALEGSRDAFAACVRAILGGRYDTFEAERQRLEGELLGGPGLDTMLGEMGKFLAGVPPIALVAGP